MGLSVQIEGSRFILLKNFLVVNLNEFLNLRSQFLTFSREWLAEFSDVAIGRGQAIFVHANLPEALLEVLNWRKGLRCRLSRVSLRSHIRLLELGERWWHQRLVFLVLDSQPQRYQIFKIFEIVAALHRMKQSFRIVLLWDSNRLLRVLVILHLAVEVSQLLRVRDLDDCLFEFGRIFITNGKRFGLL